MKAAAKRALVEKPHQEKKGPQSVPINDLEQRRLEGLLLRYQEAVVLRNRQFKERGNANVTPCDVMRAGMMALEKLTDEDFRTLILRAKDRQ